MNKSRIERALRKECFEQIKFFNPDGALGFRPDDSYFSGKEVSLARLKNWEIQELSTLDVAPAVKQACEVSFDRVQLIQGTLHQAGERERLQRLSGQGGREPVLLHPQTGDEQH